MSDKSTPVFQEPPDRLSDLASWLLSKSAMQANKVVNSRLDQPGQRGEFASLAVLEQFGSQSQMDLGRRIGYDRSDVAAVVDDLEYQGLVSRARDETDRRRNVVQITKQGKARLRQLQKIFDQTDEELLGVLSVAEQSQLKRLLRTLLGIDDD